VRQLKSLLAAILCLLLLEAGTINSLAASTPTPYDGGEVGYFGLDGVPGANPDEDPYWRFVDVEVHGGRIQDFFGTEGKNLLPGDVRTVTIRLVNHSRKTATFYLKTAARTEEGYAEGQGGPEFDKSFDDGEGKSTNLEPYFPGKSAYDPALEVVKLVMKFGGDEFYRGTMGGTPDTPGEVGPYSTTWYMLGVLASGSERVIEVTISVPLGSGNEYQSKLAAMDWIFAAYEEDEAGEATPTPTPTPSPTTPPSPPQSPDVSAPPVSETPPEDITESPPPLVPPSEEPITPSGPPLVPPSDQPTGQPTGQPSATPSDGPGEDIVIVIPPTGDLPKTGGLMNFASPIGIAILLILFFLVMIRRRERKEEKKRAAKQTTVKT